MRFRMNEFCSELQKSKIYTRDKLTKANYIHAVGYKIIIYTYYTIILGFTRNGAKSSEVPRKKIY